MARKALSASRAIDIIDFLGLFPGRGFTLSQIARAIDVNVASCHSVLNELLARGYLVRSPADRTFSLGPAIVAMGNAGLRSQPVVAFAQELAGRIAREHDLPVSLTSVVGEHVIGVFAASGATRASDTAPGLRVPLAPPIGAPFLAWAGEDEVAEWIARRAGGEDRERDEGWRRALAAVKRRGYQVLLRSAAIDHFPGFMTQMSERTVAEVRGRIAEYLNAGERALVQPERIEPGESYDVVLIAAPIFDATGRVIFNLCIGDMHEAVTGAEIERLAGVLLQACARITQRLASALA